MEWTAGLAWLRNRQTVDLFNVALNIFINFIHQLTNIFVESTHALVIAYGVLEIVVVLLLYYYNSTFSLFLLTTIFFTSNLFADSYFSEMLLERHQISIHLLGKSGKAF